MTTRCQCKLTDCAYFRAVAGGAADDCDCAHADKKFYMKNPCPLYRKNWGAADTKAEELKAKLYKKRP